MRPLCIRGQRWPRRWPSRRPPRFIGPASSGRQSGSARGSALCGPRRGAGGALAGPCDPGCCPSCITTRRAARRGRLRPRGGRQNSIPCMRARRPTHAPCRAPRGPPRGPPRRPSRGQQLRTANSWLGQLARLAPPPVTPGRACRRTHYRLPFGRIAVAVGRCRLGVALCPLCTAGQGITTRGRVEVARNGEPNGLEKILPLPRDPVRRPRPGRISHAKARPARPRPPDQCSFRENGLLP